MTDDDIVVGLKVVRIDRVEMTSRSLLGMIWTVTDVAKKDNLVTVENKQHWSPILRSRFDGFWTRWSLYEEPNDTLKKMI